MLDVYKAINFWEPIIILMKKTARKTQTSYSFYSAPRTSRAPKALSKRQKIRNVTEDFVEVAIFVAQAITKLYKQLRPTLLSFY